MQTLQATLKTTPETLPHLQLLYLHIRPPLHPPQLLHRRVQPPLIPTLPASPVHPVQPLPEAALPAIAGPRDRQWGDYGHVVDCYFVACCCGYAWIALLDDGGQFDHLYGFGIYR